MGFKEYQKKNRTSSITKEEKENHLNREMPVLNFPVCVKQGASYFRYHENGKFEHIHIKTENKIRHVQTSFSFGFLTWLTDYKESLKIIARQHELIEEKDFVQIVERYFDYEYKEFFKDNQTIKIENNYFPENETFSNNDIIIPEHDANF